MRYDPNTHSTQDPRTAYILNNPENTGSHSAKLVQRGLHRQHPKSSGTKPTGSSFHDMQ